jgi:hypothetical protein
VNARGYTQDQLIEGVTVSDASPAHELIEKGAATLSFSENTPKQAKATRI